MRHPNWSKVRWILERELRDQLRDRRTLFMVAVLPLLLYPLLGIGMLQVTQFLKKHPARILAVTAPQDTHAVALADHLQSAGSDVLIVDRQTLPEFAPAELQAWAAHLIQRGRYDLVLAAYDMTSSDEPAAEGDDGASATEVVPLLWYDAAKDRCQMAHRRVIPLVEAWQRRGSPVISPPVAEGPVRALPSIQTNDLSSADGKRAAIWSKILPFVVFVWALTGAFYPAVDLCWGKGAGHPGDTVVKRGRPLGYRVG